MPIHTLKLVAVMAVTGLLLGSAGRLYGGDPSEGIAHITDRGAIQQTTAVAPVPISYHSGYHGGAPVYYDSGNYCPHCDGWGHYRARHHRIGWGKGWLFRGHYCTHSPDHGWGIPQKHPIRRDGAVYVNYWPATWYGQPGTAAADIPRFPIASMPTDTTQLGYYYQHVPTWQWNPALVPAVPVPSHWHDRSCRNNLNAGWVGHHAVSWETVPESGGTQVIEETDPPADSGDTPLVPPPAPEAFNDTPEQQSIRRAGF